MLAGHADQIKILEKAVSKRSDLRLRSVGKYVFRGGEIREAYTDGREVKRICKAETPVTPRIVKVEHESVGLTIEHELNVVGDQMYGALKITPEHHQEVADYLGD